MLLSLAFTLFFYTAILFSWAIPLDDDSGILYRFSPASSNEIEELLSWAEVRRLRYASEIISIYGPFLSTAAQMGSMANEPFLRRRLLPASCYRRSRVWAPALPSPPEHQPPRG